MEEDTQIDDDQTSNIINTSDGHTLIDNDALMVVEEEHIRNEETVKKR